MKTYDIYISDGHWDYKIRGNMFKYLADPFIISANESQVSIIAEKYNRINKTGSIVHIDICKRTNKRKEKVLINDNFHRSYPCPVLINKKIYIFTESISKGALEIYEFFSQSATIQLHQLIQGFFVDPTIINNNNILTMYFYDGKACNDGKCYVVDMILSNNEFTFNGDQVCFGNCRPGGLVENEPIFQKFSHIYGSGIEQTLVTPEQLNFLKEKGFDEECFQQSHHIHSKHAHIAWDINRKVFEWKSL